MFRNEVLHSRVNTWAGTIRINRSHKFNLLVAAAFLLGMTVLFIAMALPYSRRTSASGYLKPVDGLPEIASQSAGVVLEVRAQEGAMVKQGQALFTIDTDRTTTAGSKSAYIAQDLQARQRRLDEERTLTRRRADGHIREQRQQKETLALDYKVAETELSLAQQRVALATNSVVRFERLAANGFISTIQIQEKQEALVDLQLKEQTARRTLIALAHSQRKADIEIASIEEQVAIELNQIAEQALRLAGESKQNDEGKASVVVAPFSGFVSAIAVQPGDAVQPGQILANMLRGTDGSGCGTVASRIPGEECSTAQLRAVVYIPSRRIGFVRAGQQVWISYDAYQQHKYGKHAGTVKAISMTPIDPRNLPAGRKTGLFLTSHGEEPMYRADIDLASQSILIDQTPRRLLPGMGVQVDLIQERSSMLATLFEPILRLKQRMDK